MFSPDSMRYDNVLTHATNQNYVGWETFYAIYGSVSLGGVVLNGLPKYTVSNGDGLYSCQTPWGWSGTVTPILAGYSFSPASRTYTNVLSFFGGEDYTPSPTTAVAQESGAVPVEYSLSQNYPNPFNPSTSIAFSLPESGYVTLTITDILGRTRAVLVHGTMDRGRHTVLWDASEFPGGIYCCHMKAGSFVQARKLILLK